MRQALFQRPGQSSEQDKELSSQGSRSSGGDKLDTRNEREGGRGVGKRRRMRRGRRKKRRKEGREEGRKSR